MAEKESGWDIFYTLRRCATPPQGGGGVMPWEDGVSWVSGWNVGWGIRVMRGGELSE